MPIPPDRLSSKTVDPDQRPRRPLEEVLADMHQQYEVTAAPLCDAAGITIDRLRVLETMYNVFTVHRAIKAYGFEFEVHLQDTEEEFLMGQQQDPLLKWQADH